MAGPNEETTANLKRQLHLEGQRYSKSRTTIKSCFELLDRDRLRTLPAAYPGDVRQSSPAGDRFWFRCWVARKFGWAGRRRKLSAALEEALRAHFPDEAAEAAAAGLGTTAMTDRLTRFRAQQQHPQQQPQQQHQAASAPAAVAGAATGRHSVVGGLQEQQQDRRDGDRSRQQARLLRNYKRGRKHDGGFAGVRNEGGRPRVLQGASAAAAAAENRPVRRPRRLSIKTDMKKKKKGVSSPAARPFCNPSPFAMYYLPELGQEPEDERSIIQRVACAVADAVAAAVHGVASLLPGR